VEQNWGEAVGWYRKAAGNARPEPVPKPEPDGTQRYWAIAPCFYDARDPESYERVWEFDLANNLISIGWSALGDISSLDEQKLRAAIDAAYPDPDTTAQGRASYFGMLWKFYHEIKPGDIVIARRGVKMIAAVGTVIQKAYHDQDKSVPTQRTGNPYTHHLDVSWHESPRNKGLDERAFGIATLTQISPEKYRKLVGPP
jgi:hypothetical protein